MGTGDSHVSRTPFPKDNWESKVQIRPLLHHRVDSNFSYLEESIWPLGGETWFVLATQNSVRQRELDFRILQEKCFSVDGDMRLTTVCSNS